ncbi:chlorite dismutase family protein [Glycomyces sp. TRM65418]|uniref:hydrogen peroxide-dependent heme synthase n=1 Tax=Glycomyces sp. TRM65418 TaxID=2867006 RepID=UPI001D16F3A2|nr:hydrogen peroxide-dependent heme synthase [Glycomyces sp. TRM65418]MCC3764860.1 chlorite dismutase family protein [Glycomyces sp. TRM65418]
MTEQQSHNPNAQRIRELNDTIRYTLWSVFRVEEHMPSIRQDLAADTEAFFAKHCGDHGVTVRGTYDLTGLRADADLMVWWHAESSDRLQKAYADFRRSALGRHLAPVWSNMALHRPAEFNRSHIPAFLADEDPKGYVCVYPFVRSYDWYLLPDEERRDLLREHGQMARDYPDVRANTVASFALGDYEWILAFEADELHRIVDLMRELRASRARLYVREEIPFYTGKRRSITDIINDLP